MNDDAGFGCAAFGHLASAFVDGELPRAEMDRYATHLPGCAPCQALCSQYRAIDVASMTPAPRPSETDWAAAWSVIQASVAADRADAAASPVAALGRHRARLSPRAKWVLPLSAAAAATLVVALTLSLSSAWDPPGATDGDEASSRARGRSVPATAVALLGGGGAVPFTGAEVLDVDCQAGWEPVVWTLGGDDAMTVVHCQPTEA